MKLDTQRLVEKLQSKLARQEAALEDTVRELENIKAFLSPKDPPEKQKAIAATIAQLQVRRMRQHNACLATEGYITVLLGPGQKTATK